ncbi:MAG: PQQ-dependent sugar dehydrogenase [Gemmataceae bacterium]|nr:PQQ-dependent sugar dehydrogenase [Gemmataceae bacterium]
MLSSFQGHRLFLALSALLILGIASCLVRSAAQSQDVPAKSARTPWTTSRVVGSPDPPPPFKVVRAFPNLKFKEPLLMARYPVGDRLIVGEFAGVLHSFQNTMDAKAELFFDLRKELKTLHLLPGADGIEALYGLVFHPDFEKNRQCYVCYVLKGKKRLNDGTRVSRFTVTKTDPPRIDPASEEIVLTFLAGGHNGGDLHFGNDGMLYISTGDGAGPNPPDPLNTGQDISDLLSSILRIDVDHRDPGEPGGKSGEPKGVSPRRNYAIPKDNPFVGMKDARPEVWAYGFRNPWRMSFDRQTGELFVGDVGWELWEMVHRVEKGGNYGWSAMEGPQPIMPNKVGPTPILPALIELPHTIATSVTGGLVYRGKKFPELYGAYIFGDWETRRLWAARFAGDRTKEMPEIARPSVRIVAFGEDKDGEIFFLDHEGGTVHTIARNDGVAKNSDFPTKLSQTGLFASVKKHTPAPGVVLFAVNSRQWQDGATAEHWAAFPGLSSATLHSTAKPIPGMVYWHNFRMHFPKDAVLVRTLSLENRRVETQLLHYDGVDWRPYTFAWRDDQTDADLVPADGAEKEVRPINPKSEIRNPKQSRSTKQEIQNTFRILDFGFVSDFDIRDSDLTRLWQFQSRSQCMMCHNNQSEYALAFLPEQLNRDGPDGRNQLVWLTEAGYIRRAGKDGKLLPPFDAASAARERKIADPADAGQPLEARARAYLHANCGHCHFEHGGGSVALRLQFSVPPAEMKAIGVRPARGDFGLEDACIIKPGEPWASTLYYRMAKFGRDRMPHIGAERPDEAGLKLIEDWIAGMTPVRPGPPDVAGPFDKLLSEPRSAMILARKLGLGKLQPAERAELLAAAAKLQPGPMRDLFEGYLPQGPERKLGSNPRPRSILALAGDPGRGEKLFWSEALKCGSCHKIGERGTSIGPELTTIGKLRARDDLLQSILEPSRRIEPKYAAYIAQTDDGRLLTGLLVKRDENEVVLRDGQNKEFTLAAKNVEALRPARLSLMPDNQMASLTAQEAADLLEYVAALK